VRPVVRRCRVLLVGIEDLLRALFRPIETLLGPFLGPVVGGRRAFLGLVVALLLPELTARPVFFAAFLVSVPAFFMSCFGVES